MLDIGAALGRVLDCTTNVLVKTRSNLNGSQNGSQKFDVHHSNVNYQNHLFIKLFNVRLDQRKNYLNINLFDL